MAVRPLYVRPREVAVILGVSPMTVNRYIKNGKLDSFKDGGIRFITTDSVRKLRQRLATR